jgi:protein-disulfide isomerase
MSKKLSFLKIGLVVIAVNTYCSYGYAAKAHKELTIAAEHQEYLNKMPTDVQLGNDNAPVTVIEYSSLSCPHCAHFHHNVFPDFKTKYIDTGKVKYIHRDFPLDKVALKGATLTHCAGKDRYYTFLKVLFEKQESWAFAKNYLEVLENIAKLGGISGDKFHACEQDKTLEDSIIQTRQMATNIFKIDATPAFVINGKVYNGALNMKDLEEILAEALVQPKK